MVDVNNRSTAFDFVEVVDLQIACVEHGLHVGWCDNEGGTGLLVAFVGKETCLLLRAYLVRRQSWRHPVV